MEEHVCPLWVAHILVSPVRRLFQSPKKILGKYIKEGDTVVDVGSALGFFSVPMAKMVGPKGRVICVDMQESMLKGLAGRAKKAGIADIIKPLLCSKNSLGLNDYKEKVDFALTFYMVHEVPDAKALFLEIFESLKDQGLLLICEPKNHVTLEDFEKSINIAKEVGFIVKSYPKIRLSQSVLLLKPPC